MTMMDILEWGLSLVPLWTVLHSWPIIATNFITLLLTGAILVLKLRYRTTGG